jgi:DNA modification methylase
MLTFGVITPILVNKDYEIIAGHGRWEALKQIGGYTKAPVIMLEHLTKVQADAYRLADNRIADEAEYDFSILKIELEELSLSDEIVITDTGFNISEVDAIILDNYGVKEEKPDKADELKSAEIVQKVAYGDIWQLGKHYLLCGDATNESHYAELMGADKANIAVCDPPYNVPIKGHVCNTKHEEFAMASGEMTDEEFGAFADKFMGNLVKFSNDGSLNFIFIDWRSVKTFLISGEKHYSALKNICVWNKTIGGMGNMYRSQHEFVCVFKNGNAPYINNIELGKNHRYRTNVWNHKGINATNPKSLELLKLHPTVKPIGLLHEILLDASGVGDIVLDPFGGSGSTLLACQRAKRKCRMIEISPSYCSLIIHRFKETFNKNAEFVRNINEKGE